MQPVKEKTMKGKSISDEEQPENDEDLLLDTSSDSDSDSDSDDGLDALSDLEELGNEMSSGNKGSYKVLSETDIRQQQEHDIVNLCTILSVPRAEAVMLLLHFNWNIQALAESWFANEEGLRLELGLLDVLANGIEPSDENDVTCGICSGNFSPGMVAAASCGHKFCNKCWMKYIGNSINEGLGCLMLRCPDPSCNTAVGQDMINNLASETDRKTFDRYFLISYIQQNSKAKWCPAPGCNFVVLVDTCRSNSKVMCRCFHSFCWKCLKEAHQPISCAVVDSWKMESAMQCENWKTAYRSKCPKCEQPVEINDRYKHMECRQCKFHFCWLCRDSWLEHGCWKGDHFTHSCSEEKLLKVENGEDEKRRKVSQNASTKYHEYHRQWTTHDMDRKQAVKELQKQQNGELKRIADKQGLNEANISFITEAWLQIAECKRVLKWACVYDYYLLKFETERKTLFDYLLRQAEFVLEQLYGCAGQLTMFLDMDGPPEKFVHFHDLLCLKTSVARNYFENLLSAIKSGHSDLKTLRRSMSFRELLQQKPTSAAGSSSSGPRKNDDEASQWPCPYCRFSNDSSSSICVMCYH